ncbi:MAG: transketolase family protein [Candidatus Daviesbacteria bacterium]|nr:transketolase family protein [Candidatus Daviesbacteria bacterium]
MINPKAYLNPKLFDPGVEQAPTRNGYGEGLVLAGEEDEQVVALCADLTESTKAKAFAEKFPQRFIEVGVAEQNLVTVAAGMALLGKIPFASSFATFSPGRNWEQIRTTVCYNDVPVKIVGSHVGVSVGPDGATHQALEDIAMMRSLPNMIVISPADAIEAKKATLAMAKLSKPCYLRLSRDKTPVVTTEQTPFKIGKAEIFYEGDDVAVIATGPMVYRALLAAKELQLRKISVRVINCHTIKPLDKQLVINAAKDCGAIVTAEEHQVTGGLGGAVAEVISQNFPVPLKIIGVEDRFGESGESEELFTKFGLTKEAIMKAITHILRVKER